MGADEITEWMAYELSGSPEFVEAFKNIPKKCDTLEEEAQAIKAMFAEIGKQ